MSRGWAPTSSLSLTQLLLASARRATAPLAFRPKGQLAHWRPTAGRSVWSSGMPPQRWCRGTTMSRGWAPTSSLSLTQLLLASARRVTAPLAFWRKGQLAHWLPTAGRSVRPSGTPPRQRCRGRTTSWGWAPTSSLPPMQLLSATAHRATAPLAFRPNGLSAHWHPAAGRSVRPSGMPPRRGCRGPTMSRGRAPTSSLPPQQLLLASAHRMTAPLVFRLRDGSVHRLRLSDRLARLTGPMPLRRSRWISALRLTDTARRGRRWYSEHGFAREPTAPQRGNQPDSTHSSTEGMRGEGGELPQRGEGGQLHG